MQGTGGGGTRIIIFHGLFGGWGWERLNERGQVVGESRYHFSTEGECLDDARRHELLSKASKASESRDPSSVQN